MNKFFMLAVAAFLCNTVFSLSAGGTNPSEVQVTKFYGAEANKNPNNPCKGATYRVCAVITSEFVVVSDDQTKVIRTVEDAEGRIISTSSYYVSKPVYIVKEGILFQDLQSGGEVEP